MKKQQGFSLVMAIFVLVILGMLGGFMATFSAVQTDTSLYAVQGSRAYQAARAGIEWAIADISATQSCTQTNAQTAMTFTGLNGFTVSLSCTASASYTEANATHVVYTVTSLSQYGSFANSNYAARQIQITILQ